MTEVRKYIIESQDAGLRLDRVLAQKCSDLSRTRIKNLIEQHKILVEGKMCLPSSKVKENDEIIITIEPLVELFQNLNLFLWMLSMKIKTLL